MKIFKKEKMKQTYIILIAALAMVLTSCSEDFLNPAPTASISATGYYENESQLETGVINMYDGLQGVNSTSTNDNHSVQVEFYLTEMRSDNTRTKNSEGEAAQFESYTIESTNGIVTDYYRSMYDVIFRANTVIANLDVADVKRDQFEGEARFVRAYAYFQLVRLFGDVPLVDRLIDPLETDVQFTRVSTDQIYDLIISDLSTAVANLENGSRSRASKAAAEALLAKVYLTSGNYAEARSLCESVMGAGYSLESDFRDVFYNEGNSEVIFSIGFVSDDTNDSQNFSAEWLNAVGRTAGVNYVTADAVAALDAMGGNRAQYSYRIDPIQVEQRQVVKYLPNGDDALGIPAVSSDPTLAGNDWIVLRYADVLLMHTEAIMAGGPNTTDAAAIASFQQVRQRAGITDQIFEVTKQMLLDERRVELAFENHRLFDLIRMGAAIDVLTTFSQANGYGFSGTDLLLPIPQREIGLSDGMLSQNPGY